MQFYGTLIIEDKKIPEVSKKVCIYIKPALIRLNRALASLINLFSKRKKTAALGRLSYQCEGTVDM